MMDRIEDETIRYLFFLQPVLGERPMPDPRRRLGRRRVGEAQPVAVPPTSTSKAAQDSFEDFTRNIQRKKEREMESSSSSGGETRPLQPAHGGQGRQGRPQRSLPLRQRQEVQEMPRRLDCSSPVSPRACAAAQIWPESWGGSDGAKLRSVDDRRDPRCGLNTQGEAAEARHLQRPDGQVRGHRLAPEGLHRRAGVLSGDRARRRLRLSDARPDGVLHHPGPQILAHEQLRADVSRAGGRSTREMAELYKNLPRLRIRRRAARCCPATCRRRTGSGTPSGTCWGSTRCRSFCRSARLARRIRGRRRGAGRHATGPPAARSQLAMFCSSHAAIGAGKLRGVRESGRAGP